jgi:phage replication O-like protein O
MMADVQLEHGFTRIADSLLEALLRTPLPSRHLRVVFALIRKLYGFGKTRDRISAGQLSRLTGIAPQNVRVVLADLASWGVIRKTGGSPGKPNVVALVKDYDLWRVPLPASRARRLADETPHEQGDYPSQEQDATRLADEAPTRLRNEAHNKEEKESKRQKKETDAPSDPAALESPRREENRDAQEQDRDRRRGARKTLAPERLGPEDWERLKRWTDDNYPWLRKEGRLEHHTDETLTWWRGEGRKKTDWVAVIQNRIQAKERERFEKLGEPMPDPVAWKERERRLDEAEARFGPALRRLEAQEAAENAEARAARQGGRA